MACERDSVFLVVESSKRHEYLSSLGLYRELEPAIEKLIEAYCHFNNITLDKFKERFERFNRVQKAMDGIYRIGDHEYGYIGLIDRSNIFFETYSRYVNILGANDIGTPCVVIYDCTSTKMDSSDFGIVELSFSNP